MSQAADNPDRADTSDLPDAAESGVAGALMPMPEPAQSDLQTIVTAPALARDALPDTLEQIATTLKRLDDRVSRLEVQPQLGGPTRRLAMPALPAASWRLLPEQIWFLVLALATTATVLFMRLFQLDQLQAEIYGDIAIVYEYIADIQAGNWPTYFSLSSGPLYHYLIMPIIALTGPSYFGMKLASVVVSLAYWRRPTRWRAGCSTIVSRCWQCLSPAFHPGC